MAFKKQLLYFIREIAIVVTGVLIAVGLNNWQNERTEEDYIQKTMSAVEAEVRYSKADVDSVLESHINLLEILEGKLDSSDLPLGVLIAQAGGIKAPSIKNVSLRFFIVNKAELIDFELISELLEIEYQTEILKKQLERLPEFLYSEINSTEKPAKIKLRFLLYDVVASETALIERYESFLDANQQKLKPSHD